MRVRRRGTHIDEKRKEEVTNAWQGFPFFGQLVPPISLSGVNLFQRLAVVRRRIYRWNKDLIRVEEARQNEARSCILRATRAVSLFLN